jgi:hypothetical protein
MEKDAGPMFSSVNQWWNSKWELLSIKERWEISNMNMPKGNMSSTYGYSEVEKRIKFLFFWVISFALHSFSICPYRELEMI